MTLGLLCLLVSDLGSNKALGPVGGIGVIFAVLSALTFLPAALLLLGKWVFWPRLPKASQAGSQDEAMSHPVWSRVGALVKRHPRRIWLGFSTLLIAACLFVPQLKADGVAQGDFVLGVSKAREGQQLLDRHFPAGSGSPAYVLTPEGDQSAVVRLLDEDDGVASVSITTTDEQRPVAPVGAAADELRQSIRDQLKKKFGESPMGDALLEKAYPFSDTQSRVVDGQVLLQVTLKDPADSVEARQVVERLRQSIQSGHPAVKIGGTSAVQLDTNIAAEHDLRLIIPLTLLVITVVLMLLLRAVVAPLILLLTTLLSFGATLGVAALMFNHVWGYSGADPSVVIYGFVFLVALGIDYNIFLMTRVREETIARGVSVGTVRALVLTGGVISSAGIVLASTFAALYVIPILFLAQIAFIVAFGVLLDTVIVRSLIVPGLTLDIGRRIWWPSRLAKRSKGQDD